MESLFLDLETSSGNPKLDSLYPWRKSQCRIKYIAFACDNGPIHVINVDRVGELRAAEYVASLLDRCRQWVNHNISYDVAALYSNWGIIPHCKLICTRVLAYLLDNDLAFANYSDVNEEDDESEFDLSAGYDLTALGKRWIDRDISALETKLKAMLGGSKDYGDAPEAVITEYAIEDILTTRALYRHIDANLDKQCSHIRRIETDLTPVLCGMERTGLLVKQDDLAMVEVITTYQAIEQRFILSSLAGYEVDAISSKSLKKLLLEENGLPIAGWTKTGNPSFDYAAIQKYLTEVQLDDKQRAILECISTLREREQFLNLFITPFKTLGNSEGNGIRLHTHYNQMVRSGRMSATKPNAQQFNTEAKGLIVPEPGQGLLVADYSQLEYRVLAHYIEAQDVIERYNLDPETDFHSMMAENASIDRDSAKTLNFTIGFGGGEKTCVKRISANKQLLARLWEEYPEYTKHEIKAVAENAAKGIYVGYHRALPTLKETSRRAQRLMQQRGYIFTGYGKRIKIGSARHHYKALPYLVQGHAACIQKDRQAALAKELPTSVAMVASVHDSTVLSGPIDVLRNPEFRNHVRHTLETPEYKHKVPILVNMGYSEISWADADKKENEIAR